MTKEKEIKYPATVTLTEEDCHCSLVDLYDNIARKLGYDSKKVKYDCRAICVTDPVRKEVFAYYDDGTGDPRSASTAWLLCGPKANLEGGGYVAEVTDKFIIRKDSKKE